MLGLRSQLFNVYVLPSSGDSPAVYQWVPDLEKLEAEEHQEHEL